MQTRTFFWLLGIAVLIAAGLGTWVYYDRTSATGQYVLRLKWLHQAQFAGFYAAAEQGYYRNSNLDIRIEQGGQDFPAVRMIVSGGEDFGVTGADQILLARSQGADVVPLMVIYRDNPFVLFARTSLNIRSPADFVGHKIGVKVGGNEELIYRALIQRTGVTVPSGDEIPVQFDLAPFLTNAVQIWPGYAINEPLLVADQGVPVSILRPSDFGVRLYADVLFTSGTLIREHPDVVRTFVQASLRGWNDVYQDPDLGARLSMRYASGSNLAHQTDMMRASLPYIRGSGGALGRMSLGGWQQTQRLLRDGGFLASDVNLQQMLTEASSAGGLVE